MVTLTLTEVILGVPVAVTSLLKAVKSELNLSAPPSSTSFMELPSVTGSSVVAAAEAPKTVASSATKVVSNLVYMALMFFIYCIMFLSR
jgi:hypothetical protein